MVQIDTHDPDGRRVADTQWRRGLLRDQSAVLEQRLRELGGSRSKHNAEFQERWIAALAEIDGLRTALETRGVIEQAKGMIMLTLKVDEDAAFEVLTRRSQASGEKLVAVARDVVARGSATGSLSTN